MPLLDVSEVLDDPLFQAEPGSVKLRRQIRSVTSGGVGVHTAQPDQVIDAVVIQGGGDVLRRTAEADELASSIRVYTKTHLVAGDGDAAPDEILWKGTLYRVASVRDWTDWGIGFCEAECTLVSLSRVTQP